MQTARAFFMVAPRCSERRTACTTVTADPQGRRSRRWALSPKRSPPKINNMVPEPYARPVVCRDRGVGEMARHDLPQPFPLFRDRLVSASLELLLHFLELCPSSRRVEAAALFGLDNLRRKRLAVRSRRKVTAGAP
jgi:hypothetical protein